MSVASGFAEYEIKAINSAINAEEPKLQAAQSILDRSRSLQTARQTNDILLLVHRIGQDALVWSNQRYALLSNVASGGNGFSMDQSAQNDIRYAQSSLEQNWSNLKYSKQCQGF